MRTAILLALIVCGEASAQAPSFCTTVDQWMASLKADFGEEHSRTLVAGNKALIEMANQKTQTWTIGELRASTQTICTVASGIGFIDVPPKKDGGI